MAFRDYNDLDIAKLELPIDGKVYVIPPLSVGDAIRLDAILKGSDDSLKDAPANDLWKLALGSAYDEMLADNVPANAVSRAGMAAIAEAQHGRAAAEAVWDRRVTTPPPAVAPAKKAPAKKATRAKRAAGKA